MRNDGSSAPRERSYKDNSAVKRDRGAAASVNRKYDGSGKKLSAGRAIERKDSAVDRYERRERERIKKEKAWNEGIERVRSGQDWVFFIIVMLLVSVGTVMVYSASYPSAIAEGFNAFHYVGKQIIFVVAGVVVMLILSYFPIRWVKKLAPPLFGLTLILLAAVPFVGKEVNGAKRWIQVTSSIRLQPSEIAKFTVVVMLAWYVSKYGDRFLREPNWKRRFWNGVVKPSFIVFIIAGMIAIEKHLSATIIVVAISVIVLFLAGTDWKLMLPYYGIIGSVAIFVYLKLFPYAMDRVNTFTNEAPDIFSEYWQTYQGKLAIGSGGFLGLGLGQSRQKFSYVAEAQNDFVFTIWCEEMGFVGALVVIGLFVALIVRGYRIALRAPDTFSSLIVFGIITQVGLQAFLNILVVTDTIMNTGISLPFLSYGGSSLIVLMGEMGVVLSVSRQSYQKKL
ncbi:MAG: cell division protein FtsW [Clostridia bacterium]|nr:cell division protein FtsW [Clostridia bacterium]